MSGCIFLLIDESSAMGTRMAKAPGGPLVSFGGPDKSKAESVATVVNSLLSKLALGPNTQVTVVGYRTVGDGQLEVGPRWGGLLAGRDAVGSSELAAAPVTVERRTRRVPGPGGFPEEQPVDFPIWYQPQLGDKAPQLAAFQYCLRQLTEAAARLTADDPTPLVIHIFAGSSGDGNPTKTVKEILELSTPAGSPLVLQIHLSSSDTLPPTLYPANRAYLPVGAQRDLFDRASPLPPHLATALVKAKFAVLPKSRGMVYNAKLLELSRTLSLVQSHLEPRPKMVAPPAIRLPPMPSALAAAKPTAAPVIAKPAPVIAKPAPVIAKPAPAVLAPVPVVSAPAPVATPPITVAPVPPEPSYASPVVETPAAALTPAPVDFTPAAPAQDSWATETPVETGTPAETGTPLPIETPAASAGTIAPDQPALVLFVLDRSVQDPFSGSTRHSCAMLQEQMGDIVEQIVKFGNGAIDVGVVSYGVDGMGEVEVRTALEGGLSGRVFARDNELEASAVRLDESKEELSNGVGGLMTIQHRRPILIEAEPTYAASPVRVFAEVAQLVANWCRDNPTASFSPIVLHLTRGQLAADDVTAAIVPLATVATGSGAPVVLYHLVATETEQATLICPDNEFATPDLNLQTLWRVSSLLLGREELAQTKPSINGSSRGFVVNGKPNLLLQALRRARDT